MPRLSYSAHEESHGQTGSNSKLSEHSVRIQVCTLQKSWLSQLLTFHFFSIEAQAPVPDFFMDFAVHMESGISVSGTYNKYSLKHDIKALPYPYASRLIC